MGDMGDDERGDGPDSLKLRHADYQGRYYRERRKPRRAADGDARQYGPIGGHRPSHTGYQPLIDFLATCPDTAVTLPFDQIEAIIGAALPGTQTGLESAFRAANNSPAVRRAGAIGWRLRLDLGERCLHCTQETP